MLALHAHSTEFDRALFWDTKTQHLSAVCPTNLQYTCTQDYRRAKIKSTTLHNTRPEDSRAPRTTSKYMEETDFEARLWIAGELKRCYGRCK